KPSLDDFYHMRRKRTFAGSFSSVDVSYATGAFGSSVSISTLGPTGATGINFSANAAGSSILAHSVGPMGFIGVQYSTGPTGASLQTIPPLADVNTESMR